jgi:hypothetical protein
MVERAQIVAGRHTDLERAEIARRYAQSVAAYRRQMRASRYNANVLARTGERRGNETSDPSRTENTDSHVAAFAEVKMRPAFAGLIR